MEFSTLFLLRNGPPNSQAPVINVSNKTAQSNLGRGRIAHGRFVTGQCSRWHQPAVARSCRCSGLNDSFAAYCAVESPNPFRKKCLPYGGSEPHLIYTALNQPGSCLYPKRHLELFNHFAEKPDCPTHARIDRPRYYTCSSCYRCSSVVCRGHCT